MSEAISLDLFPAFLDIFGEERVVDGIDLRFAVGDTDVTLEEIGNATKHVLSYKTCSCYILSHCGDS